jgi:uncharacterized membrane protein (UPF0127 family)
MKHGLSWVLIPVVVAGAVAAGGPGRAGSAPTFGRGTLTITQGNKRVVLNVEIANTMATRSYGLMFRRSLPENAGMLFVFEEDARWGFWMKNTLIPLSIGFIDNQWRLIEIKDMAVAADPENGPFPTYEASAPYRHALEVNQGFFQRKGITTGARLELTPAR